MYKIMSYDYRAIMCIKPYCLTHQRLQLFVVCEVELSDKVIKMLVAGVDVSLSPHLAHAVKVVDVDVYKHTEQTRQNLLSHLHEGLREGSTWQTSRWRQENTPSQSRMTFCYMLHVFKATIQNIFPVCFLTDSVLCNLSEWIPPLHMLMETQLWETYLCSYQVIHLA